jgi:hypothetical protein
MKTEWRRIGKVLEGSSHILTEVLSQHLPGGTENRRKPLTIPALLDEIHNSRALPIAQPVLQSFVGWIFGREKTVEISINCILSSYMRFPLLWLDTKLHTRGYDFLVSETYIYFQCSKFKKLSLYWTNKSTMPWRRMGSGRIKPRIVDLGTSWRWVVSFTSQPLYPLWKSPRYPLDGRLGGPQNRSGLREEEKNLAPNITQTTSLRSSTP